MKKLISFIIITLLLFIFTPNTIYSSGRGRAYTNGCDKSQAAPEKDRDIIETIEESKAKCIIKLANGTHKTYVFWLSWIDHPFLHQTQGKPWSKIVAEIDPAESFTGESKHAPGLYTIKCREAFRHNTPKITKNFSFGGGIKTIVITLIPDKNKMPMIIIFKYDT